MPGGHPLGLVEIGQPPLGLGALKRDRLQSPAPVPAQQAGEEPHAEAAVRVVED